MSLYRNIDGCQYVRGDDNGTEVEVTMKAHEFAGCCTPLTAGALDEADAVALADALKVLADPARLRLLSLIASASEGEACACDLVEPLGRSQPTVSHHLSMLVEAGFLTRDKRGKWAWYRIVPERIEMLRSALGPSTVDA